MSTAPTLVPLPERSLLLEMSRTLAWQGRPGLWATWLATLPGPVAAELRAAERAASCTGYTEALAENEALRQRSGMATWFPRKKCA